ncbi:dienelactone hydrolase family protein [Rhodohalobacter sp. 8-1]|uniref:dienelactone hydrolase family protein n=1 Tax=Rhodohalobacter sp. 8-1 TaxID=3131972 RepID=UPI0030EF3ED1
MKLIYLLILSFFLTTLSAAQNFALEQLENSPRHHEWVTVEQEGREVYNFVAYPETSEDVPVMIVIHENRGLTDWVRSFADQMAEAGYIAIAPDLLSGFDEDHSRTPDYASSDAARDALYQLNPDQITADLMVVQSYAEGLDASNGTIVVGGFCWGGSQTFRYATNADGLDAAMVFYGSPPSDEEAYANISVPVYGFYGEDDQRINSTIPETEELMEQYGNTYDYVIYDGAGHAYMRRGDDPNGSEANKSARDQSWERLLDIMSDL